MARMFGTAALFAVVIAPAAFASSSCFTPTEAGAARLRALQQAFNVGALSCPDSAKLEWTATYNSFVSNFKPTLSQNARLLKAHFASDSRLDSWMTRIAQDAASRASLEPGFCQWAEDTITSAISLSPEELQAMAIRLDSGGGLVPACAVKSAKPVIHVAAKPTAKHSMVKTIATTATAD